MAVKGTWTHLKSKSLSLFIRDKKKKKKQMLSELTVSDKGRSMKLSCTYPKSSTKLRESLKMRNQYQIRNVRKDQQSSPSYLTQTLGCCGSRSAKRSQTSPRKHDKASLRSLAQTLVSTSLRCVSKDHQATACDKCDLDSRSIASSCQTVVAKAGVIFRKTS